MAAYALSLSSFDHPGEELGRLAVSQGQQPQRPSVPAVGRPGEDVFRKEADVAAAEHQVYG